MTDEPKDKKEEPAEDNKELTGSYELLSAEQAGNIVDSPEFDKLQKNRIKKLVDSSEAPQVEAARRSKEVTISINLIRSTKGGDLMADVLHCRYFGYSHKKIAKTLMKGDRALPIFSSLSKAIKFVEELEKEGTYRVKVALAKRSKAEAGRIIIP